MSNVPTPHIKAEMGEIAEKILMPGDPLRAKFIAENYLTDAVCVNDTRNMLGFTGNHTENPAYKDKEGLDLEFSLEAAWRIFSNASETSKETIWKARNEEPAEGYLGNDAKVESCGLAIPNQCIYFKWPSATRPEDGFYIYLPAGCQIEEIGAAHDGACDEWSVKCTAEIVRDEEGVPVRIPIENRFGHTSDYLKYSILKSAVITNVRVMFNVLDPNA